MQQPHYARHARVGVWGSHALDKKVGVTISPDVFFANNLRSRYKTVPQIASHQNFLGFSEIFFLMILVSISVSTDRI